VSRDGAPLLELRGVDTHYGPIQVLRGVDLQIGAGEVVCLLGPNAAGKTTTLKTILGFVAPTSGEVLLEGERVDGLPPQALVGRGITMVPENRRLFRRMTVQENLELGAFLRRDRGGVDEDLDRVFGLFPRLKERLAQRAGTLSGGEQQMVAVARALMARPRILLMDEPSMGLAPVLVSQNFAMIEEVNKQGTTVFLVEQNANMALRVADRGYVLQTGRIVLSGSAASLRENPQMREAYLGEL
jgi:branched-chain amino acid transport system ATP-binding protein